MSNHQHMQDAHAHQVFDIWAVPSEKDPTKYEEWNRCSVCKCAYFVYHKPLPIPEGMATEEPA